MRFMASILFWLVAANSASAESFDNRSYVKMDFISYHQEHTPAEAFYVATNFNCQNRTGLKPYYVDFADHEPTASEFLHAARLVLMKLREVRFPTGCSLELNDPRFIDFRAHAVHNGRIVVSLDFSTNVAALARSEDEYEELLAKVDAAMGGKAAPQIASGPEIVWAVALRQLGGGGGWIGIGETDSAAREDAVRACQAARRRSVATRCIVVAVFSGTERGCVTTITGSRRIGVADLNVFYDVNRGSRTCRKSAVLNECTQAGAGLTGWDCRYYTTHTRDDALSLRNERQ